MGEVVFAGSEADSVFSKVDTDDLLSMCFLVFSLSFFVLLI